MLWGARTSPPAALALHRVLRQHQRLGAVRGVRVPPVDIATERVELGGGVHQRRPARPGGDDHAAAAVRRRATRGAVWSAHNPR